MAVIYVDNNATTCIAPEVLEAMMPFLTEQYGNPSSMHTFGGSVAAHCEQAREEVAALIGAHHAAELMFTSCGTESNNAAIHAAVRALPERRHIITSRVEHPAVKNVIEHYQTEGYRVSHIGVDRKGHLAMDELRESLDDDTALVSIMYANNETGVVFPVNEIGTLAKQYGALFHCDAVQAAGKIPLEVNNSPIDFLSISGHKIHAPKGVGALYVREKTPFTPFFIGGHQERGRRGGTENVASIVGFGAAARLARQTLPEETTRVRALRDKLERSLLAAVPDTMLNGAADERIPNTTNISFEFIEGESILLMLDRFGICASSGSACTSGSLEPSHVLRAMGVPYTAAHGSVRFSLSRYTTEQDIDVIIEKVPSIITRLREISPFDHQRMQ